MGWSTSSPKTTAMAAKLDPSSPDTPAVMPAVPRQQASPRTRANRSQSPKVRGAVARGLNSWMGQSSPRVPKKKNCPATSRAATTHHTRAATVRAAASLARARRRRPRRVQWLTASTPDCTSSEKTGARAMPSKRHTPMRISRKVSSTVNCPPYQSNWKGVRTPASWASKTARSAGSSNWLSSQRVTAAARSS